MNFIEAEEINITDAMFDGYMPFVEIRRFETKRFIRRICEINMEEQLLKDMQALSPNITAIDVMNYTYKSYGRELDFNYLSGTEIIYLLSYVAKYTHQPLYLEHDVSKLQYTLMTEYYNIFKDCDNINIIGYCNEQLRLFKRIFTGEISFDYRNYGKWGNGMITYILGRNNSGRTSYLRQLIRETSKHSNKIITNVFDTTYLDRVPYNEERLGHLRAVMDTDDIIENMDMLYIPTEDMPMTYAFSRILTLICKEGDYLYLDEPEHGLVFTQLGFLIYLLNRIDDTFKEIVIVSRSESIISGTLNHNSKTIKYDKENDKYILLDAVDDDWFIC